MRFILLLISFLSASMLCRAQYVYTIKADSVLITSSCDSAELIIQNHTQAVTGGFLYNNGGGRTIFKKALTKINDSTYLIGADTLKVVPAGNAVLFNTSSAQTGYVNLGGTLYLSGQLDATNNINISNYGFLAVGSSYVTDNYVATPLVSTDSLALFPFYGSTNPTFLINGKGVASYTQDYGSLFTTRSLVDKGYVDSSVLHGPTLQSVTNNGSSTSLGISASTLITTDGANTMQTGMYANSLPAFTTYLVGPESGSNAGANYSIGRYSDAGASLDFPFTITRSSGLVTLLDGLNASGAITFPGLNSAGIVRTSSAGLLSTSALSSGDVTGALGYTPLSSTTGVSSFNGISGAITYNPTWQTILNNGASVTTAPTVTLSTGNAFNIVSSTAGTTNLIQYHVQNDGGAVGGVGITSSSYSSASHPSFGANFTYVNASTGLALASGGSNPVNFETNGLLRGSFNSAGLFSLGYGLSATGAITFPSLNTAGFLQTNSSGTVSTAALSGAQVTTALGFTPLSSTTGVSSFNGSSGAITYNPTLSTVLTNGNTASVTPVISVTNGPAYDFVGSSSSNTTYLRMRNDLPDTAQIGIAGSTVSNTSYPALSPNYEYMMGPGLALIATSGNINLQTGGVDQFQIAGATGIANFLHGPTVAGNAIWYSGNVVAGTGIGISGSTVSNTGVTGFNTRTGAVTLTSADVTSALGFTPLSSTTGVSTFNGSSGAITYNPTLSTVLTNGSTASIAPVINVASGAAYDFSGSTATGTTYLRMRNNLPDTAQIGIAGNTYSNASYPAIAANYPYIMGPGVSLVATSGSLNFQTGGVLQFQIAGTTGVADFHYGPTVGVNPIWYSGNVVAGTGIGISGSTVSNTGVTGFNTRTGAVTLTSADVTGALGYTPSSGTPTLQQVTTAGNSTTVATTIGNTLTASNLKINSVNYAGHSGDSILMKNDSSGQVYGVPVSQITGGITVSNGISRFHGTFTAPSAGGSTLFQMASGSGSFIVEKVYFMTSTVGTGTFTISLGTTSGGSNIMSSQTVSTTTLNAVSLETSSLVPVSAGNYIYYTISSGSPGGQVQIYVEGFYTSP